MDLSTLTQLLAALLFASAGMTLLWLIQRRTRNAGVVDVGWSALIGVLAIFFAATSDGDFIRRVLIGTLMAIWSARLSIYLFFDRVWKQPEEGLYVSLRKTWGENADRNLFFFFQAQAILAWLFALPAVVIAKHPADALAWTDFAGVALWLFAVSMTVLSDFQLSRFKRREGTQGRTCREGLWRYSRHPNFFFEWLHWCSYVVLAIGSAFIWVPIALALTMLIFMLFITGIPPTEARAVQSRSDYRDYQKTTSPFIPWFPKTSDAVN